MTDRKGWLPVDSGTMDTRSITIASQELDRLLDEGKVIDLGNGRYLQVRPDPALEETEEETTE